MCPTERTLVHLLRLLFRLPCLAVLAASTALAQPTSLPIAGIYVMHIGPPVASDEYVRGNIRVKIGDPYLPVALNDDVRNLYATGLFYNVRVTESNSSEGMVLNFVVQGFPRITDIKFTGNTKFSDSKLKKMLTSKVGEPLNERKLFTDSQEIQKRYQKAGYPRTEVRYVLNIEETAGRGTAVFEIKESPKVTIAEVNFDGATAFTQKELRKVIKTRKRWWLSWLTGSGVLKDDQFQEDQEHLREFFRDHGYLDFDIKDIQFLNPTPSTMVIRFVIYEGTQYKVGSVKFTGNKIFTAAEITAGLRAMHEAKRAKAKLGPNGLVMDTGNVFTPKGYQADHEAVADFYGAKGYIDVSTSSRNLNIVRIPNTETGTIDLDFQIEEGQKSYIEKIEIRGNTRTKDRVIRRELAVSPGEPFDMVRVKISKLRLEGLRYFEKVDARPEPTDISPARKNLVIGVEERNTGNLSVGAGFSSVDSIVGSLEFYQANFDLFHPPTFTGAGQKLRLRAQIGTEIQNYVASFIEPWLFGQKLSLGVDLYYRTADNLSPDQLYNQSQAGGRVSVTRALWNEFLRGSMSYTLENIGIHLEPGATGTEPFNLAPPKAPPSIIEQEGYHLLSRIGGSLTYDTRGGGFLPNKGQRTEFLASYTGGPLGGDVNFYKLELQTAWYFKGFAKGHIFELIGRAGVAESLDSTDVPFYERYYLGGLYTLRGFKYRNVSPRDPGYSEPVGGDTFWFGSAEYTIPIYESDTESHFGVRFAIFYDVGNVVSSPYDFTLRGFSDNWGVGLHLNLPIGPIRIDYGIPVHHDQYNSGNGRIQFGVSYTRDF